MDAAAQIAALTQHPGRAAGTDAERRTALHLRDRLRQGGIEAHIQPTEVHPRHGLTYALHAVVAIGGSLVATTYPWTGTALVGAATLSAALDIAGLAHLGRRLTGRRASQNLEWREERGGTGVVILAAGYDSPRASLPRWLGDPWAVLLAGMLALLVCCGLRAAGIAGIPVTVAQFVPTVVLIALLLPLLEAELSKPGLDPPGAVGTAVVLQLAEELHRRLGHLDLWVVLTGASRPFGLGMTRWLRRRRPELAGRRAVVVNVGPLGDGPLRYSRREGPVFPRRSDPQLLRICGEIAEDDRDGVFGATPAVRREPGNGFVATMRGVPALSVWSDGERASDPDRAAAFCRELLDRLDADLRPG